MRKSFRSVLPVVLMIGFLIVLVLTVSSDVLDPGL